MAPPPHLLDLPPDDMNLGLGVTAGSSTANFSAAGRRDHMDPSKWHYQPSMQPGPSNPTTQQRLQQYIPWHHSLLSAVQTAPASSHVLPRHNLSPRKRRSRDHLHAPEDKRKDILDWKEKVDSQTRTIDQFWGDMEQHAQRQMQRESQEKRERERRMLHDARAAAERYATSGPPWTERSHMGGRKKCCGVEDFRRCRCRHPHVGGNDPHFMPDMGFHSHLDMSSAARHAANARSSNITRRDYGFGSLSGSESNRGPEHGLDSISGPAAVPPIYRSKLYDSPGHEETQRLDYQQRLQNTRAMNCGATDNRRTLPIYTPPRHSERNMLRLPAGRSTTPSPPPPPSLVGKSTTPSPPPPPALAGKSTTPSPPPPPALAGEYVHCAAASGASGPSAGPGVSAKPKVHAPAEVSSTAGESAPPTLSAQMAFMTKPVPYGKIEMSEGVKAEIPPLELDLHSELQLDESEHKGENEDEDEAEKGDEMENEDENEHEDEKDEWKGKDFEDNEAPFTEIDLGPKDQEDNDAISKEETEYDVIEASDLAFEHTEDGALDESEDDKAWYAAVDRAIAEADNGVAEDGSYETVNGTIDDEFHKQIAEEVDESVGGVDDAIDGGAGAKVNVAEEAAEGENHNLEEGCDEWTLLC